MNRLKVPLAAWHHSLVHTSKQLKQMGCPKTAELVETIEAGIGNTRAKNLVLQLAMEIVTRASLQPAEAMHAGMLLERRLAEARLIETVNYCECLRGQARMRHDLEGVPMVEEFVLCFLCAEGVRKAANA